MRSQIHRANIEVAVVRLVSGVIFVSYTLLACPISVRTVRPKGKVYQLVLSVPASLLVAILCLVTSVNIQFYNNKMKHNVY